MPMLQHLNVRMADAYGAASACVTRFENFHGRQAFAFEKFEEGATCGRDIADLIFDTENVAL